jgi:hypothetical protein
VWIGLINLIVQPRHDRHHPTELADHGLHGGSTMPTALEHQ